MRRLNLFITFTLLSSVLFAARDRFIPTLPFHEVFPVPNGIIFPSLLVAGGVNGAALPQMNGKVNLLGLSYSPSSSSGQHRAATVFSRADKTYGLSLGANARIGESLSGGYFLAGGFKTESTSVGLSVRDSDVSDGNPASTDVGLVAHSSGDITFGLVLYHLEEAPQLDLGVGFGNNKNYNFELNLLLPGFSNIFKSGNSYIITAATTVYAYFFGLSFKSSYNTFTYEVTQSVSLMLWLSQGFGINVQYLSPNRSYYGLVMQL